jgi:hypothetical protein
MPEPLSLFLPHDCAYCQRPFYLTSGDLLRNAEEFGGGFSPARSGWYQWINNELYYLGESILEGSHANPA